MFYCINPDCLHRENQDSPKNCISCGTPLLIRGRYYLSKPIRDLKRSKYFEVFEAEDTVLAGKQKILKVLKVPHEGLIQLFRREAQVLSWLDHPGIPAVEPDGYFPFPSEEQPKLHCLVMEKVEGQDLGLWIQDHPLASPQFALKWLKELTLILDQIHKNNLFHGDIKPSNIIRKLNGQIVLIDFGAVKQTIKMLYGQKEHITLTPGYAAPEQLKQEAVPQSDFYALGRTFAHLLTGRHPIELTEKEGRFHWRHYLPEKFPNLLADFIDDLMSPAPSDRPRNTDEVLKSLDQIFHVLLASPTPEVSELPFIAEVEPKQGKYKSKFLWNGHKVMILVAAVLFMLALAILGAKLQFKFRLPIPLREVNLLPNEVILKKQTGMQVMERGIVVASANFYPDTETFVVDDEAKDGRRAYVEYKIPATSQRGVCQDADGASSPVESCNLYFKEDLDIYWRICVRDADGPKPTVCSEIKRDKT
jgi:serine/threonine protein kinase